MSPLSLHEFHHYAEMPQTQGYRNVAVNSFWRTFKHSTHNSLIITGRFSSITALNGATHSTAMLALVVTFTTLTQALLSPVVFWRLFYKVFNLT